MQEPINEKSMVPPAVQIAVTQNDRIVVLRADGTIWQRILDPQNMQGGQKFMWQQIAPPG